MSLTPIYQTIPHFVYPLSRIDFVTATYGKLCIPVLSQVGMNELGCLGNLNSESEKLEGKVIANIQRGDCKYAVLHVVLRLLDPNIQGRSR